MKDFFKGLALNLGTAAVLIPSLGGLDLLFGNPIDWETNAMLVGAVLILEAAFRGIKAEGSKL